MTAEKFEPGLPFKRGEGHVPKAIWSGTFQIGSIEIRCYVLDTGQRVVDSESIERLFSDEVKASDITPEQMAAFAKWQRGLS